MEILRLHDIFKEQQIDQLGQGAGGETTKSLWSGFEASRGMQKTHRWGLSKCLETVDVANGF